MPVGPGTIDWYDAMSCGWGIIHKWRSGNVSTSSVTGYRRRLRVHLQTNIQHYTGCLQSPTL